MLGVGFFALTIALVFIGFVSLLREDRVTALAKAQIARLAGDGFETNLDSASLNYFQGGIAGINIEGISIANAQTGKSLLERGNAFFAISLRGLLTGQVQLTDLSLTDAEMHFVPADGQGATLAQSVTGPDGLIDPALVSQAMDAAADAVSLRLAANPDLKINAANTKLIFGADETAPSILLEKLVAAQSLSGDFTFEATVSNSEWKTGFSGAIGRTTGDSKAAPYRLNLEPIPFKKSFTPQAPDNKPRHCEGLAGFAVASSNGLASIDLAVTNANCTLGSLGDYAMDVKINGNLKRGIGVFEIARGVINVNRSVFNFDGAIAPARYTPKPELTGEKPRYRYELVFAPSLMDSLDNQDGALPLSGKIAGTYTPAERRLAMDEFIADANGAIVRGAASLLFTDVTPALYLALTSDKIQVRDFKRIWPRFASPTARRAVMDRVTGGTISNMRLELQLPPGKIGSRTFLKREQLTGSGDITGGSFATYGDLPPAQNAKGRVRFDGVEVNIDLESATSISPSGKEVKLKPSSFIIPDTHVSPLKAELKISLFGDAGAVAEIAAKKPINAFQDQEISPADLSGNASAEGVFDLILSGQSPPQSFNVSVNLEGVDVSKAINGQIISNASGTIKANTTETNIRFDAEIGGLPAKIIITEPRGAPERRTQEIALTLTDAARKKLAPGLEQFLSGPVSARVKGESKSAEVELDFTKAKLRLVPFNWEKGAGIGAKASFNLSQNGSSISVSKLQLSGKGLEGSGKLEIKNGALLSAELRNLRLNPRDDFSLSLKNDGQVTIASLGGTQFDARALMRQLLPGRSSGSDSPSGAVAIKGKVKRLIGFNDEIILNAEIGFSPGRNSAFALNGEFDSGGSIELSRSGGAEGRLIVDTKNAGAALRFVDLYKRMVGGSLKANFTIAGANRFAGPISISDFIVFGEPRLAKLASGQAEGSASLAEATQADLGNEKAAFELAQGEVVLDRGTIKLDRGILRGKNVGATAEGIVLSAAGQMDLRGTFMPARGLNRIVGAIPLLGIFLGSGNKAGLIGITYQLAGDAKNPKVFVNPISMIAPGVFRQIFE